MKKIFLSLILLILGYCVFASVLTDYVYNKENIYKYEVVNVKSENKARIIEIKQTSQIWQNTEITNTVLVFMPDNAKFKDKAVLLNTGGSYEDSPIWANLCAKMANLISCPMCVVFDIPNQPMWGKKEDALMAWTFKQAFEEKSLKEKPLLLQMARSVIKSMDAIGETSEKEFGTKIDKFIITGASKRGWTSWISAGTKDKRIVGIMPIVFDWLDIKTQFTHQKEYYGELSARIGDYTELNFDKLVDLPEAEELLKFIDPLYYDIKIPKLIINATNDRFWTLDSSSIYYPKLNGEKYLFYKINSDHDMGLMKFANESVKGFLEILPMINDMKIFIYHVFLKEDMEKIDWKWLEKNDKIICELKLKSKPIDVLYYTNNVEKRDFRDCKWQGVKLEPNEKGEYIFIKDKPEKAYCASFIEVKFKSKDGTIYSLFTSPYVSK